MPLRRVKLQVFDLQVNRTRPQSLSMVPPSRAPATGVAITHRTAVPVRAARPGYPRSDPLTDRNGRLDFLALRRHVANPLFPQLPCQCEHNRADHQPDESKHFEAAQATHEHPDKRQTDPAPRNRRPHHLVAGQHDGATEHERDGRRVPPCLR